MIRSLTEQLNLRQRWIRYLLVLTIVLIGILISILTLPVTAASVPPRSLSDRSATMTPQSALDRLFTSASIQTNWFAASFLAQVPLQQVQSILISLKAELGAYQAVTAAGGDYRVMFEKGTVPTKIVLNAQGQITGLLFQPPRLNLSRLSEAVAQFKSLPGNVSLLVREGNTERAALNSQTPLAVGSTFKLAVLAALKQQVATGQRAWAEIVPLQATFKSLPSGFLQTWPEGALLSVQSLAALMISQSDNTATDHLIQLVGRSPIESLTPRNRPFLMTREAFILKSNKNAALLKRYRAGNADDRRKLLSELATQPLPDVQEFTAGPIAPDVEWFLTTTELCNLMAHVQDLPLMSINPGAARADEWERVAYKGGSEPGVLNLTTWLRAKTGKQYCVSATWNHTEALPEERFIALYASTLEVLK